MLLGRKKINFNISETVLKKNKIPVLLNYGPWKKFYSVLRSKDMESDHKRLIELVEENNTLKKLLSGMQSQKRTVMAKIVLFSRELNEKANDKAAEELESLKSELEELKESIDSSYERLEELPKEIENANLDLLKSTIKYVYDNMAVDEDRLKKVNDSIEEKRRELDMMRQERDELGMRVDSMYSFMHNIVGSREMEKLDREFSRQG